MTIETKYPNPGSPKYSVRYSCGNCGWNGCVVFAKGKRAPDTTTCSTCGVSGAKKSLPYRRTEPMIKDPVLIPIIPGAWPNNPARPWPKNPPHPSFPSPVNPYKPYPDITQRQTTETENDTDHD